MAIVFDSPPNLYGIKALQYLDIRRNTDHLSYRFEFQKIDYNSIFSTLKKREKTKLKYKHSDILANLITDRTDTKFLKLMHDFLYFCTSHVTREFAKIEVINALYEKRDLTDLSKHLKLSCKDENDEKYLKLLIDYLKSDEGKNFAKTLRLIKKQKLANDKSFCEKQGVPLADLKFVKNVIKSHLVSIKREA